LPVAGSRWGESTPVLLLECLDVHGIAYELGAANAEVRPYFIVSRIHRKEAWPVDVASCWSA